VSATPSPRLDGKVLVVTGASSGIGFGIAQTASEAGANVVLVGRDKERLAHCAKGVREHRIVSVDLTEDEAPETIVRAALDSFGSLDGLVHSAGIWEPMGFLEGGVDVLDRQWEVNVRAPYALSRAAVPHMREGSSIVFISSIAGHSGFPNSVAYCATKGAIELLTKALAMELSPREIRVNCVAPGNIRTPMNAERLASPEYEAGMIEATPLRRIGVVEEVAPSVVFLSSDAARFIQGTTLLVDGGWTAQ
jgi:NAD(P)-dependent dehydrogenase (short-subunit alcohol dehydrogenase family)